MRMRRGIIIALVAAAGAARDTAGQAVRPAAPSIARADAIHLLQRATFGARPQDIDEVLAGGRDRWLDRQLMPSRIADDATAQRLARLNIVNADMAEMLSDYIEAQRLRRQAAASAGDTAMTPERRRAVVDSVRRAGAAPGMADRRPRNDLARRPSVNP